MALAHAGINKPFVARDVTEDQRLRQHTDLVAVILNSLIRKGRLVQLGIDEWDIYGPLPDQPVPPTGVSLAAGGLGDGGGGGDGWVVPGPAGQPGAAGLPGAPGVPGDEGPEGPAGVPGAPGPAGAAGPTGSAGPLGPAYTFVAEEGPEGPPGIPGGAGNIGPTGPQGNTGDPGPIGPPITFVAEEGPPGADGIPGPQGLQGPTGAPGADGQPGAIGPAVMFAAEEGPEGQPGPPGLAGAAGAQGAPGNDGAPGAQGPIGPPITFVAEEGPEGQPGAPGPQGPAGSAGSPGVTGADGPVGPAYTFTAEEGPEGQPGAPGNPGAPGATGAAGPIGPGLTFVAEEGPAGQDGIPGPQGPTGAIGPPGPPGPAAHLLVSPDVGDVEQTIMMVAGTSTFSPAVGADLLPNGDFRVNQRGVATYDNTTSPANNDDTYLIDTWNLISEVNNTVSVAVGTNNPGVVLTVKTINDKFGLVTFFEAADGGALAAVPDRFTLSLSWTNGIGASIDHLRVAVLQWNGTADALTSDVVSVWNGAGVQPTWATNWTELASSGNLAAGFGQLLNINLSGAGGKNLAVVVWHNGKTTTLGDTAVISYVKFERGATAQGAYQPIAYAQQLARCQRTYFQLSGTTGRLNMGRVVTTSSGDFSFPLPVTMRAAPVAALAGANVHLNDATVDQAATGIALDNSSKDALTVRMNVAAATFTVGRPLLVYFTDATSLLSASAEL